MFFKAEDFADLTTKTYNPNTECWEYSLELPQKLADTANAKLLKEGKEVYDIEKKVRGIPAIVFKRVPKDQLYLRIRFR